MEEKGINTSFRKCNVLGVNIACVNMPLFLDFTQNNIKGLKNEYICATNVHTVITAYDDEQYKKVQNTAVAALPDGGPIASYCIKKGFSETKRTTGPDFMGEILKLGLKENYKHFFYGSTKETLTKLKTQLENDYKGINIVGMYSPPFRKLTDEEDKDIIKMINDASPDFVWIGLGAPKQEIFMYEHKVKIKSLMVGVGAAFDFFAGNIKRAPAWMQKLNLEWLYRLLQDPKRLFARYLYTNTKFIFLTKILRK